jgi:tetratricopeptide (TPR) repeat protein
VRTWLSKISEPWLLIFDQADDRYLDIFQYIPPCDRGVILITTRNPESTIMGSRNKTSYWLGPMDLEEAVMLFEKIVGFQKKLPSASTLQRRGRLVGLLERSPLAITQASAFILQDSCDIDEYCRQYAQQRDEIFVQPHYRGSKTSLSSVATLELTLKKLRASVSLTAQYALALLEIISFLHYDGITEEMFHRAFRYLHDSESSTWIRSYQPTVLLRDGCVEWEPEVFSKALSLLSSYSLIGRHNNDNNVVFLHPLVTTWTQERLPPADRRRTWALTVSIIAASIPCTFGAYDYRFRQSLLPHLNACLSYYGNEVDFRLLGSGDCFSSMASKFVLVYQENNRQSEALQLMEVVVAVIKSTLSEGNPVNLSLMQELANRYTEVGRQEEALQLEESIVVMSKSILREEHRKTVFGRGLARSYNRLDRGVEASQIAKPLNRASQKSLGEELPTFLSCWNHPLLAPDTQSYYFANVEGIYRRILTLRVKLLGTKDLDTPPSMKNLAEMLRSQSSYDEAVEIFQQTLKWREVPDSDNLSTLSAMIHLVESLQKLGRNEKPDQIHRQILEMRRTAHDRKHMSTSQNLGDSVEMPRESLEEDEELERAERALWMQKRRSRKLISFGEERADRMYSDHNEDRIYEHRRIATFESLMSESYAGTLKIGGEKFELSVSQTKQELSRKRHDDLFHSPSTGAVTESTGSEDDPSISSSMSNKDSESSAFPLGHNLLATAFSRVAGIFSDDDDIGQLLSEALVKNDHRRVTRNINRLLAWLGHRLLLASNTSAEREVAKLFLASKRNRNFIDLVIRCSSLDLSKEKLQDQESNPKSPETQSQRPAGTVASTEFSGGSPDVDLIDPNDEETDISHDYGTECPNHDIDLTKDEQQGTISNVDAGIAFLKSSDAFARLKEELEDFVRPLKNERMWTKMLWDGDEQVRFELSNNVPRANSLDKLKLSTENMLGMPVIWWPLRQPRRYLPASKVRITWICVSQPQVTLCKTA